MGKKKIGRKLLLATAAATAVYTVATGKGPFNKYRFKKQHEELSAYVESKYPGCTYGPISAHGSGWASVILKNGTPVSYVYFTRTGDGTDIYTELDEQIK